MKLFVKRFISGLIVGMIMVVASASVTTTTDYLVAAPVSTCDTRGWAELKMHGPDAGTLTITECGVESGAVKRIVIEHENSRVIPIEWVKP